MEQLSTTGQPIRACFAPVAESDRAGSRSGGGPTRTARPPTSRVGGLALTLLIGLGSLCLACSSSSSRARGATTTVRTSASTSSGARPSTTETSSSAPSSNTPSTGATSTATLDESLATFAARHGDQVNRSSVVQTADGTFAAVSYQVESQGVHPHVEIVRHESEPGPSGAWVVVADLQLPVGGTVVPGTTSITVAHVTGSVPPDFAATTSYNAGLATSLVSDTSGRWHALGFRVGGAAPVDQVLNATIDGSTVTDEHDDCVPDCAHGTVSHRTFRYDASSDTMVAPA